MTEAEWLTGADMFPMLRWLGERADERRLRLFACACCRSIWHLLDDDRSKKAVQVAELLADEVVTEQESESVYVDACNAISERAKKTNKSPAYRAADAARESLSNEGARLSALNAGTCCSYAVAPLAIKRGIALTSHPDWKAEEVRQAHTFRDLFGNPFRRVKFAKKWRTSTSVGIAQTMYDARDFAAMPILADAIQDAGCEDAAILAHCRGDGPHVRGCWVVDLVLGKA